MLIKSVKVPECEALRYLGSIVQKNSAIREDVDHRCNIREKRTSLIDKIKDISVR